MVNTLMNNKAVAQEIWNSMDDNQKTGVRVGMFPFEIMEQNKHIPRLASLLMACAQEDGGMRA